MHGVEGGVGTVWHALGLHLAVGKGDAGDDQAGAALGALGVIVDSALVEASLGIGQPQRPHGRHGKAVFDGEGTDLYRGE